MPEPGLGPLHRVLVNEGGLCRYGDDQRLSGGVGSSFNYAIEKRIHKIKIGATGGLVNLEKKNF